MRIINLKPNGVGRYDDVSPFIITDKKLALKINLPNVNGEFFLVSENNGEKIKRLLPGNGEITLEGLSAGELNAAVKHYLKGGLIKTYTVEPLVLIEVDGELSAEPEIAALRRDLDELKETLAKERKNAAERDELLEKLKANELALIRFAFSDYSVNAFLKGGSFENFVKEYGFELDEELNSIKGEKKDDET